MKVFGLLREHFPPAAPLSRQYVAQTSRRSAPRPMCNSYISPRSFHDCLHPQTPLRRPLPFPCQHQNRAFTTARRRYAANPPPNVPPPHPNSQLSISQRFRKLSREYGWSAMGVYFALSALDFPFCFLAVQWLGVERIGRAEKVVVEGLKRFIPEGVKDAWREMMVKRKQVMGQAEPTVRVEERKSEVAIAEVADEYDHGVKVAEKENKGENATVAYAIHKSFIFVRLPLTVAITPKVVKVLRGWGWDIGKRRAKGVKGPGR